MFQRFIGLVVRQVQLAEIPRCESNSGPRVKPSFKSLLVCPACHSDLLLGEDRLSCTGSACGQQYPLVGKIPILLSEQLSTFRIAPYRGRHGRTYRPSWRTRLRRLVPRISGNLVALQNFKAFVARLLAQTDRPQVLILGGAERGAGISPLLDDGRIECLESDVVIGSRTEAVFDASYLPLRSNSVDGVVVQAVLEYVLDPALVAAEIYRVLKPGGIVYSEMPFLQSVHGGRYDFTRLTHLGHLRLFRHFEEISSGACAGPATTLAWSLQQFFLGFVRSPRLRDGMKIATGFLFFWIHFFDYVLATTPGGLDGATGTYLMAAKSDHLLSDHKLLEKYRGAVPVGDIL